MPSLIESLIITVYSFINCAHEKLKEPKSKRSLGYFLPMAYSNWGKKQMVSCRLPDELVTFHREQFPVGRSISRLQVEFKKVNISKRPYFSFLDFILNIDFCGSPTLNFHLQVIKLFFSFYLYFLAVLCQFTSNL